MTWQALAITLKVIRPRRTGRLITASALTASPISIQFARTVLRCVLSREASALMTADVYVVLIQDRHTDPEVEVFANPVDAIDYAEKEVREGAGKFPEDIEILELTPGMLADGWVFAGIYSCEGDSVTVMKRQVK